MIRLLTVLSFTFMHCSAFAASTQLPQFQNRIPKSAATKQHLFAYNTATETFTLAVGAAIPFNATPLVHGHAIKQTSSTTFKIKKAGNYAVHFFAAVAGSGGLGAQPGAAHFRLNGELIGQPIYPQLNAIVLQEVITVPKSALPATLDIVVTDVVTSFIQGSSAGVSIVRLSK